jgi:hypothetical protein
MNRKGEIGTLITYERALFTQAKVRKFLILTNERKQMSTKTTFKRVALVAVAALGLGVLTSVAPATAASVATAVKMTPTVVTTTPRVGETVTILVNHSGFFSTATADSYQTIQTAFSAVPLTSTTTSSPVIRGLAYDDNTYGQAAAFRAPTGGYVKDYANTGTNSNQIAALFGNSGAGVYNMYTTITFTPDVAGTWVINVLDPDRATYYNQDISITVAGGTYSTASTLVAEGSQSVAANVSSTTTDVYSVDGISALATASNTAVATFKVTQKDANGVALSVGTKAITISTTLGSVGTATTGGSSSYAAVAKSATAATQNQLLYLFPDGRTGKAVVTIAVDGVTVGTYNVTFYSTTIASLTLTPSKPLIAANVGTSTGGGATATDNTNNYTRSGTQLLLVAKDASGNEIPAGLTSTNVVVSSSDSSVATATIGSYDAVNLGWKIVGTPVGAGTTTITVSDKATGLVKATGTITVSSTTIASIAMTTDKTNYAPGDKVTVTLTAKDAKGNPIADGVYFNLLGGAVASTQIINAYPFAKVAEATANAADGYDAGDVSFKGGIATASFYAPASTFKLMADLSTSARLAYALQATTLTATATVTNASTDAANAATDAANEATDAANAATDAALAAADAADAATAAAQDASDAVAALSATVAKLVASLKAQITSLTNLVIKIQKKVKA